MSCYVKSQKVKFSDERVIRSSVFTKMLFYPIRTEHVLEFNSYQLMNAPEPIKSCFHTSGLSHIPIVKLLYKSCRKSTIITYFLTESTEFLTRTYAYYPFIIPHQRIGNILKFINLLSSCTI